MTFAHINNLPAARRNLTLFVLAKAEIVRRQFGFGYVDSDNAPANFHALQCAFAYSKNTRLAMPVWNGCSDNTVYTNPGANFAFRFWHDVLHVTTGRGFDTHDEVAIGTMHVQEVQAAFGKHSLEALLMYADTIAQSMYAAANGGQFPAHQLEFVTQQVVTYIRRMQATNHEFLPEIGALLEMA